MVNVNDQVITDEYAIYNGDSCEVLQTLADESVGLVIYSPPFAVETGGALYNYSSSIRDLSNARSYKEFFEHYEFIAEQTVRALMPGRICAVHCMDVPLDGANVCGYSDFPGDIIKLHRKLGCEYTPRIGIWKEPLEVRNRTMSKSLAHIQICEDATQTCVAAMDYLIPFRKKGKNPIPVTHEHGLMDYCGERPMPNELLSFRGWKGKQTENKWSHLIWRRYASSFWDDIRIDRVLPYQDSRDSEDERHQHPLQLDVYERAIHLWTNPGEIVVEPFMGVGSGPWSARVNGRRGWGCELKPSFFRQAKRNLPLSRAQVEGTPEQSGRRQASIDFGDDDDPSEPTP